MFVNIPGGPMNAPYYVHHTGRQYNRQKDFNCFHAKDGKGNKYVSIKERTIETREITNTVSLKTQANFGYNCNSLVKMGKKNRDVLSKSVKFFKLMADIVVRLTGSKAR